MSFFSSLVANVTSGVANLGLNSRRFSLSRQDSNEAGGNSHDGAHFTRNSSTPSITVSSTSGNTTTPHGEWRKLNDQRQPRDNVYEKWDTYFHIIKSIEISVKYLHIFLEQVCPFTSSFRALLMFSRLSEVNKKKNENFVFFQFILLMFRRWKLYIFFSQNLLSTSKMKFEFSSIQHNLKVL